MLGLSELVEDSDDNEFGANPFENVPLNSKSMNPQLLRVTEGDDLAMEELCEYANVFSCE
jgi:hypothetical protein